MKIAWVLIVFFVMTFFGLLTLPWLAAAHAQAIGFGGCVSPDQVREGYAKTTPRMTITALDAKVYVDTYNALPPVSHVPVPDALLVGENPDDPEDVAMFVFRDVAYCHGLALRQMFLMSRRQHRAVLDAEKGI